MMNPKPALARMPVRFLTALALGTLLLLNATAAFAQDFKDENAEIPGAHPAHIHKGSCAQLDPNPAYPINSIALPKKDDKVVTASDMKGSLSASPVQTSETTVDVKLDDLLTEGYAINVHESAQNIQNYIACGDIGGFQIDDKVTLPLKQVGTSGFGGIAVLEKDGDKTKVTVFLAKGMSGASQAPPTSATPAP